MVCEGLNPSDCLRTKSREDIVARIWSKSLFRKNPLVSSLFLHQSRKSLKRFQPLFLPLFKLNYKLVLVQVTKLVWDILSQTSETFPILLSLKQQQNGLTAELEETQKEWSWKYRLTLGPNNPG